MSEIFNHIFSLQHVYQVQYVMLHKCTRIDKTGKNIDCKNCSFTSNLHFFLGGGGGHLNLAFAKNTRFIHHEMSSNERKLSFSLTCSLA